jgi:predicted ATPase with chaperone activity
MLARRLASTLPQLALEDTIEASTVWSVAGLLPPEQGPLTTCLFRSPHHTASDADLIGGRGVLLAAGPEAASTELGTSTWNQLASPRKRARL